MTYSYLDLCELSENKISDPQALICTYKGHSAFNIYFGDDDQLETINELLETKLQNVDETTKKYFRSLHKVLCMPAVEIEYKKDAHKKTRSQNTK